MEPYIGQISMFGFNYAPQGWAKCNGQLLQIAQNQALYSLLGTHYGGDGRTTFALPDLQGRLPMHQGQGAGRRPRTIGQSGGQEQVTLTTQQLPAHNHSVEADNSSGRTGGANSTDPSGHVLANPSNEIYSDRAPNSQMNAQAIGNTGGSQGHDNVPPFQVINFCIALQGVYPPRP